MDFPCKIDEMKKVQALYKRKLSPCWNVHIIHNLIYFNPILFLRVPILCDFEPLHQHVRALHNLVKAAQSLDEMSQTITDLLNEQKVFLFFFTKKSEYSIQKISWSHNCIIVSFLITYQ